MNINFQSEYSLTDLNKIIVNIGNINLGLANAIRRSLLSEIPIIGFNDNWNNEKHLRNIVIEKKLQEKGLTSVSIPNDQIIFRR
mgnify:CR=1 FL=1